MVTDPNVCMSMCFRLGFAPRTPATYAREELERAVAAERERCAKIAENLSMVIGFQVRSGQISAAGICIAAKIRKGV